MVSQNNGFKVQAVEGCEDACALLQLLPSGVFLIDVTASKKMFYLTKHTSGKARNSGDVLARMESV